MTAIHGSVIFNGRGVDPIIVEDVWREVGDEGVTYHGPNVPTLRDLLDQEYLEMVFVPEGR